MCEPFEIVALPEVANSAKFPLACRKYKLANFTENFFPHHSSLTKISFFLKESIAGTSYKGFIIETQF